MWKTKVEAVNSLEGDIFDRYWLENEAGKKLIWGGLRGEDAIERFGYEGAGISLSIIASRFDRASRSIGNCYVVWLGTALKDLPITVEQAREISLDVRDALLAWRLPGKIPEQLGCEAAAVFVSFDMKAWSKWNSSLEKSWP